MPDVFTLYGPADRAQARRQIDLAAHNAVVTIRDPKEVRTGSQNRLVHRWFADVARAVGDQSEVDIKAECNLTYGRPILARDDPEWESAFGYIFDSLSRPAKLKAIRVLDIPFTRKMSVSQLREYMDQMRRDYAEAGIYLTDPELRKYEGAA